jgi:hypothetical protein
MFVTVCEFASVQADGTATLVRSGIDQLVLTGDLPVTVNLTIYVEIGPAELPEGDHDFEIRATGGSAPLVLFSAGGKIMTKIGAFVRLVIPFSLVVQSEMAIALVVNMGGLKEQRMVNVKVEKGASRHALPTPAS